MRTCRREQSVVYTCDDEGVVMAVADSRTFRSGNSEAVRLPRNVAFGREVEVTIVRSGDVLTVYPTRKPIGELVKQLEELPRPSEIEARDDEVLPEPSGLRPWHICWTQCCDPSARRNQGRLARSSSAVRETVLHRTTSSRPRRTAREFRMLSRTRHIDPAAPTTSRCPAEAASMRA